MARKAREKSSTGVYAVILRGYERIFKAKKLRGAFTEAADKYLGEGLMGIRFFDDHVHMLIRESEKGISLDMKPLITSFARTYNKESGSEGKVFADRFKSVPVETAELEAQCMEYLSSGAGTAPYDAAASAPCEAEKKPVSKKAAPKKAAPKKSAVKKEAVKKAEPVAEPPKPKKKNNLPSWLL